MDDFCCSLCWEKFVLEEHAKQRNLGFNREADAWHNLSQHHGNRVAFRRRKAASATYPKRTFNGRLLRVWIPCMPVLYIFVDAEDRVGRCRNSDSVFDLHSMRWKEKVASCAA